MKKIAFMIAGVLILVGGAGLAYYLPAYLRAESIVRTAKADCLNRLGKKCGLLSDPDAFCACNAEFSRKTLSLTISDQDSRDKFAAHMTGCLDIYVKPLVYEQCDKVNGSMAGSYADARLSCDCFYNHVTSTIPKEWSEGKIGTGGLDIRGKEVAQEALGLCLKQ